MGRVQAGAGLCVLEQVYGGVVGRVQQLADLSRYICMAVDLHMVINLHMLA
jgi:hypothetical protein